MVIGAIILSSMTGFAMFTGFAWQLCWLIFRFMFTGQF
jgi:hypothetical protein